MRVVFFASGEFAVPSLRWLLNSPHEVVLVVTQPDRPAGRGKIATPTPVGSMAQERGLPCEKPSDVNTPELAARMRDLHADIGIVIAFGQKILAPVRDTFAEGCVNLHGSLLPRWRGAAPINAAILAGDGETGVTVFRLVDRMDAGAVLVKRRTAIKPEETAGELHDRLAAIGCDAIDGTFKLLADHPHAPGEPQDESQVTRAGKLSKADGFLRFEEPAVQIARRCRAMTPWPGARCRYESQDGRSEDITCVSVSPIPSRDANVAPGTMTDVLTVATGSGMLEIVSVLPAGKRIMSWQDFVNGRHVRPGDRLTTLTL